MADVTMALRGPRFTRDLNKPVRSVVTSEFKRTIVRAVNVPSPSRGPKGMRLGECATNKNEQ